MNATLASTFAFALATGCATAPHMMPAPAEASQSRTYSAPKTQVVAAVDSAFAHSQFPIEHAEEDEDSANTRCVNVHNVPALARAYASAKDKRLKLADERCRRYTITVVNDGAQTVVRLRAKTIHVGDDVTSERWDNASEQTSFAELFGSIDRELAQASRTPRTEVADEAH